MATYQKGLIVADDSVHSIVARECPAAYTVTSWQNDRAPKTQQKLYAALKAENIAAESVFDASHGRRYMLFCYAGRERRAACWDCVTSPRPA